MSVAVPKRMVPSYTLGARMRKRVSRVARPRVSSSSPVASGSSVPQWPIFFCRRMPGAPAARRRARCRRPPCRPAAARRASRSRRQRFFEARDHGRPHLVARLPTSWPRRRSCGRRRSSAERCFSTSTSPRLRSDTLYSAGAGLAEQRHRLDPGDRARQVDQPLGVARLGPGAREHLGRQDDGGDAPAGVETRASEHLADQADGGLRLALVEPLRDLLRPGAPCAPARRRPRRRRRWRWRSGSRRYR